MAYYTPLIKNYDINTRSVDISKTTHIATFKKLKALAITNNNNDDDDDCVPFYGFGPLICMRGKFDITRNAVIPRVYTRLKDMLQMHPLTGSIAFNRSSFPFQHFVLDFDLKKVATDEKTALISNEEYKDYLKLRTTTRERYFMDGNDVGPKVILNVNYFVYEIIFFLTEVLKLDWVTIHILGKGRSLRNGFHLEIPQLVMSYHDIAVLSTACHKFIPNSTVLDAPVNYSVFGSQKYNKLETVSEIDCAYLPYLFFSRRDGGFCREAILDDMSQAFEMFNLFKEQQQIYYGFEIHSDFPVDDQGFRIITDILKQSDNDDEQQQQQLLDGSHRHNHDQNVRVGYQSYTTIKSSVRQQIPVYKNLLHITTTINDEKFDYRSILPIPDICNLNAFLRKKQYKIGVYQIPGYRMPFALNECFTNRRLHHRYIESVSTPTMTTTIHNDDISSRPFSPFTLQHVMMATDLDSRISNTVLYLLSIYLLSEEIVYPTTFLIELYRHLKIRKEKLDSFLNILRVLQMKKRDNVLHLNETHQNWAVLCMKHLLITRNVMNSSEAMALYQKQEEQEEEEEGEEENEKEKKYSVHNKGVFQKKSNIVGAVSDIKIPDIIIAATINYDNVIATDVFELLALYCPLIQKSDGSGGVIVFAWEDYSSGGGSGAYWKLVKTSGRSISVPIPQLEFIVNVYLKREKNQDSVGFGTVINRILAYWKGACPVSLPSILWKFDDCYFLTGTNNGGYLIDILPLPMYSNTRSNNGDESSSSVSSSSNCLNSYQTDELVRHMISCPFLQNQLFPLVRKILQTTRENDNDRDTRRRERGERMRSVINSRDKFVDTFEDQDVQVEMEIEAKHQGEGDARSTIPCSIDNFLSEKRRLIQLSKDQYHAEFVEMYNNNDETVELIKIVKCYVLKQMCRSLKDMTKVEQLCGSSCVELKEMIRRYNSQTASQNKKDEPERMRILAVALYDYLHSHPSSAQLSDINAGDYTEPKCHCSVTYTFINLLQTFSYDVVALRYVLSVVLSAVCYGNTLKDKQVYFFLGNTNSGKTNFLKLILSVLGGMAGIISPHTAYYGSSQDRIHDLGKNGETARFWYMDEIGHKPFNRQLINQISGNSPLFLRTNYSEGKMIQLAPSIFIFGNNTPTFNENCPALVERLRFFTFRSQFSSRAPTCFKYSRFPQLEGYQKIQDVLTRGLAAILLHAVSSESSNSPFYIYNIMTALNLPNNVRDSSVMYSPVPGVAKSILHKCGIEEEPTGAVTVKRMTHLLKNLNVLKPLNISSTNDALKFLDHFYPTSTVNNDDITCPLDHKDEGSHYTAVYQGLLETDMYKNNEKICSGFSNKKNLYFLILFSRI